MNQDQRPQPWWKDNRLAWALAALALIGLLITLLLGYWLSWEWTGLVGIKEKDPTWAMRVDVVRDPKFLWDWLELLIIPVVLGAGALWFNNQTRKSEQALAQDRAREEALQRYLDTMQGLILDKELRRSEKDAEIRDVARARTLTVLRSLDGNQKGQVVRFLYEADLIRTSIRESRERWVIGAIIYLRGAELSGANLSNTNLFRANLSNTNLFRANLSIASLMGADLRGADLTGADLFFATLSDAKLSYADLRGANLKGAIGCTKEQWAQAESLVDATMPDGTKMTEEAWEAFKKRYRK
jgi:uncharacterized protein YjbI with pentapeptide repeats